MVEIFLGRKIRGFGLLVILLFLGHHEINGFEDGKEVVLATKMKLESRANNTRYQWIERFMKNHLQNDREMDNSILHVIIHPKVNPHLSKAVLKACSESSPSLIWKTERDVISSVCNKNESCSKITRVIGIYEDVDDIKPHEWKNFYGLAWNPRSKIAIWLGRSTGSTDSSTDKVKYEEILENFWSLNAINVVLLATPFCKNNDNCLTKWRPKGFGYNPFIHKNGRSEKRGKLVEVEDIEDGLFPDKLKNLHGMSMRVSIYQQEPHVVLINFTELGSGIGVEIIRYMEKWLNFTVELISSPTTFTSYSIQLPDGENVGPIGDILKNRSIYLANSEYVQTTIGKRVEFLRPFAIAYALFIVPPAGMMPGIFRIFRSVDLTVIIITFLNSFLLMLYFIVRKKRNPLFRTYRLLVHQQIEKIGNNNSERIFLMFWIIWAFILCTAGQSQLIKDLTDPPFYKSIDTLKELIDSPLTLMLEKVDINSLKYSDVEVKNRLAEKSIYEDNFAKCMETLLDHRNVSCAIDSIYIDQVVRNIQKKRGRQKSIPHGHKHRNGDQEIVHVGKEILSEYWRTIVVQEGFPYLDKFNVAYDKMIDFGLDIKWFSQNARRHFEPPAPYHVKLTITHFEGTFKILLFGLCFAIVIFIGEIIYHRMKNRDKGKSFCPKGLRIFTETKNRLRPEKSQTIRIEQSIIFPKIDIN